MANIKMLGIAATLAADIVSPIGWAKTSSQTDKS